jgi:hypothetical protein
MRRGCESEHDIGAAETDESAAFQSVLSEQRSRVDAMPFRLG